MKTIKTAENKPVSVLIISYTRVGKCLAGTILQALSGDAGLSEDAALSGDAGFSEDAALSGDGELIVRRYAYGEDFTDTHALLEANFRDAELVIFICAAGIAVRQCAPFLKSKAEDPAVLVIDERGLHVISLLSGHLGGGNAWCRRIAALIHADPVITTATDLEQVFAVDLFAKDNDLWIEDLSMIREVSARILKGEPVGLLSDTAIEGSLPEGLVPVQPGTDSKALPACGIRIITALPEAPAFTRECRLHAKNLWAGCGCRKGVSKERLAGFLQDLLAQHRIPSERLRGFSSIDLKKGEAGLSELAAKAGLPLEFWSAEELNRVSGSRNASAFVKEITGTDAVAERSALLSSGGKLLIPKTARDGMTFALAASPVRLTFTEQ